MPGEHGAAGGTDRGLMVDPVAWPPGWHVEHVAATGSTNDDLLASASERPDRSVLVADYQRAGRGRRDRVWTAMPGTNLLASILFHEVPADANELPRRVSVATVDACRRFTSAAVALKWPNDVLLDDGKLAGVLAQRAAGGSVVVGVGVNVGWAPDGANGWARRSRSSICSPRCSTPTTGCPRRPRSLAIAIGTSWRRSVVAFASSCQLVNSSASPLTSPLMVASSSSMTPAQHTLWRSATSSICGGDSRIASG